MSRIDHVAVEASDPDATAAFYEGVFGARVVKAEGHPLVRVSAEEQARLRTTLDELGIEWEEHDHGIAVGLFFRDPDNRLVEAITYRPGDDPHGST